MINLMRIILLNNAKGQLTVGLVTTCLLTTPAANALPRQRAVLTVPKSTAEPTPRTKTKAPVLARNTASARAAAKTNPSATASTAKQQAAQPKTIAGRCWKRLMDNVREVTRAHRNRTK